MSSFLNSAVGFYVTTAVLNILLTLAVYFIHKFVGKIEQKVDSSLPTVDAAKINHLLNIIDQLTQSAVMSANNQIVEGLKQHQLFTPQTAASVKQAVINQVLNGLGPLKDEINTSIGPLTDIIGHSIEKHVSLSKGQGNSVGQM